MGKGTKIEWTATVATDGTLTPGNTWNPWWGCAKVSPGCVNCYADALDSRYNPNDRHWGVGAARRRTGASNWQQPLKWNKAAAKAGVRARVFCASMGDWLDPEVTIEWLADLLVLIYETPNLDWQLLTKRPELWRERMSMVVADEWAYPLMAADVAQRWLAGDPPPNVWLGTSVEDQRRADERIPALLMIPARVRFLSMEPLLEAVDLTYVGDLSTTGAFNCLRLEPDDPIDEPDDYPCIDWTIIGGESGPGARPCHAEWIRSIVRQCKQAGVAVFVKQLGAHIIDETELGDIRIHLSDAKGGDPVEWPDDLNVRQFPDAVPSAGGGE